MAEQQRSKSGGGNRKHGRNRTKCERYRSHMQREKNKLKRIRQSCGLKFTKQMAKYYGMVYEGE